MAVLRQAVLWLLVIVASGTAPVAVTWASGGDECGETCARCWCRQRSAAHNLRAACPCCDRHDERAAVTLLPPAVLPDTGASLAPPAQGDASLPFGNGVHALPLAILDPPPRFGLQS